VGVLFGAAGRSAFSLNYVTTKNRTRVELLMQSEKAKDQIRRLMEDKAAIEAAFRGPLEWYERENSSNTRVYSEVEGGYRSPPEEWPAIHEKLIDAMIRLDAVMRPRIPRLP
jgi:hypothetical protein